MSSSHEIIFLILKFLCIKQVVCSPLENDTKSFYDQRQTGKYNIHISLRDVAIIEVDKNEFSDETINNGDEYYYDYEDLTIKPISNLVLTTVKTLPQIVNTSLKSEIVNSQTLYNAKAESNRSSTRNLLTNLAEPKSSSGLNSNASTFVEGTSLKFESGSGTSLTDKPVSHFLNEARTVYVPNVSTKQKSYQQMTKSRKIRRENKINSVIPTAVSARASWVGNKMPTLCNNNKFLDAYGNCKSLRRSTFLKTLFDVLKIIRVNK